MRTNNDNFKKESYYSKGGRYIYRIINDDSVNLDPKDLQAAKIAAQKARSFNGLCATEWAALSSSVWNDVSSAREKRHLDHGATFPEKLCDRLMSMYSKSRDTVLDPFLGTGTTVISAIKNRRNSIGIELTDRFFSVAKETIERQAFSLQSTLFDIDTKLCEYQLLQGDCTDKLKLIGDEVVQLTITSPPYADLIHKVVEDRSKTHKNSRFVNENNATTNLYSDDSRDLGNMPLEQYLRHVEIIMQELFRVTKKGGYNAWVVKDFRDTKNGIPYVDLHTKIATVGEKAGFLYHDLIIWDQNAHRKLVLLGYPSTFYVNQNHSYIVVMRKPK